MGETRMKDKRISHILAVYLHKVKVSRQSRWICGATQGAGCLTTSYQIGSPGKLRWVTVRTLNMSVSV